MDDNLTALIEKFDNEEIKGLTDLEQVQIFNALKYLEMYQKIGTIAEMMELNRGRKTMSKKNTVKMTEHEAIEELKERYLTMSMCGNIDECKKNNQATSMAISALEKRISAKPIKKPDKHCDLILHYSCPSCGRHFGQRGIHNAILFNKERYCQGEECGQALDWGEE